MNDVTIKHLGDPSIPDDAIYLSGPSRWRNPVHVASHHPDEGDRVLKQYVEWIATEQALVRDAHSLLGRLSSALILRSLITPRSFGLSPTFPCSRFSESVRDTPKMTSS